MALTCPACGEESPDRFRFCGVCGGPLPQQAQERREIRKTVTVLFCDVVDSTPLGERLDPESLRRVMGRYFDEARAVLSRHGGRVEKFIGDAVMAVFGVPVIHEDDALRAVRAADELRGSLSRLNVELLRTWGVQLSLRTGVNTGQVVAGDPATGQTLVTGDTVNVAARLEQVAVAGEIMLGSTTYQLVRDAVVVEPVRGLTLKGKSEPVEAWRLLSVIPGAQGRARRLDTPLVGRSGERQLLRQALGRAVDEQATHLFTLLGPAGVGKSRLVHEFLHEARGKAQVVRGRCLDYGEGITFWPVVEIVRSVIGGSEADGHAEVAGRLAEALEGAEHAATVAQRVAALVTGTGDVGPPDEIPWTVRKLLEGLARRRPLVVVVDDLHWAEPGLLDLVEHLADWSRDAPILLLCIARPELLDERPAWAGGKYNATTILLQPLALDDCSALVDNLLGGSALTDVLRERIATAAEGNPLFVEELVAMFVEEGKLTRDGDVWVAVGDLTGAAVPPSITALLAARLDRLEGTERSVLERASVVGKTFYRTAVSELSPPPTRQQVSGSLMALVRKELIRQDTSGLPGDDAFRFRHMLLRDAAYAALPKRDRAEMHERFAGWLEQQAAGGGHHDEMLGYHLEQAHVQRMELGADPAAGAELAHRASRYLSESGRRALSRSDVHAATVLLERARRLAPPAGRSAISPVLVEALLRAGRLTRAAEVVEEELTSDPPGSTHLLLAKAELDLLTLQEASRVAVIEQLRGLLPRLTEQQDHRGAARALNLLARAHWVRGEVTLAEATTREALGRADSAGSARDRGEAVAALGFYTLVGATPVGDGIAECERLLATAGDDRRLRASLLQTLAGLHGFGGDFTRGRAMLVEARSILSDLGLALEAAQQSVTAGMFELYAGDPIGAEEQARHGFEALEAMGEREFQSSAAAVLAMALHLQGLSHEAARFAALCEGVARADDVMAQVQWRTARARVRAGDGELQDAERLVTEAVDLARRSDLIWMLGDTLLELSDIHRRQGRSSAALASAREARALYDRKQAPILVRLADDVLEELTDAQDVRT